MEVYIKNMHLNFQIIYAAKGLVIKRILVTDGSILTNDITMSGDHDILFLKTDNGGINSTVVNNCMIRIRRYRYILLLHVKN